MVGFIHRPCCAEDMMQAHFPHYYQGKIGLNTANAEYKIFRLWTPTCVTRLYKFKMWTRNNFRQRPRLVVGFIHRPRCTLLHTVICHLPLLDRDEEDMTPNTHISNICYPFFALFPNSRSFHSINIFYIQKIDENIY